MVRQAASIRSNLALEQDRQSNKLDDHASVGTWACEEAVEDLQRVGFRECASVTKSEWVIPNP